MNRRVIFVLAVSVAVNLLFAGMLLGHLLHRLMPPPPFNVAAELQKLPGEKRALFSSIMEPAKQRMDAERTQIDNAKKEALRLLKTEPFSEDAYLTQTRRINDMRTQMKRHIDEAVAKLARQLTQDERDVLAEIASHPPFAQPPGARPEDTSPPPPPAR